MFIRHDSEPFINKKGKEKLRIISILFCDCCSKEFIIKSSICNRKVFHFCSNICVNISQKKGGKLFEKKLATFQKKYGYDCPFGDKQTRLKINETNIIRYGGLSPLCSNEIKEKSKATSLKNYGVPWNLMRDEIQRGTDCHGAHSIETIGKMQVTLKSKDHSEMLEKMKATVQQRYGVDYVSQIGEVKAKRHITKKKNGTYRESAPEIKLREIFSTFCKVEKQVTLFGESIDIFLPEFEIYIQVDGVYWHALNENIKNLALSPLKIDKVRLDKFNRDRNLDEHCAVKKIKLIRITDMQIKSMSDEELTIFAKNTILKE